VQVRATREAVEHDPTRYSVLAVDDTPSVLQLLVLGIEGDVRLRLAGVASDGDDAVRWVSSECPDAIICDLVMPRLGGLDALPALRETCPDSVIIVFSSTPDIAFKAHQLGADAVFDKVTPVGEVLDHVALLCRNRS
jgi:two-component system, chemotaxis family, protein-glutamate methylesterase/glutaminase